MKIDPAATDGSTIGSTTDRKVRFAGVAAADVYLRRFEAAVMPMLHQLPGPAHLVNARGRVAASADPRQPGRADGVRLMPCEGVPLVLVVAE